MARSHPLDMQTALRDLRRERRRADPAALARAHAALSDLTNRTRSRLYGEEPERRERPSLPAAAE